MLGFDFKKNSFLGIDIGTSAIKIAEIKVENRKPTLSNYAWMPISHLVSEGNTDDESFDAITADCIEKMLKEGDFSAKEAYVALPAIGGLLTLIEFPVMPREDIEQAIRFEAHKYIPTSLEEVVLSWDVLGEIPNDKNPSEKHLQILLVAASKKKVERYEAIIKKTGLKLKSLELESFSMVNALIGNDTGRFIIVDIGANVCNIMLVDKGVIRINRNIDAGGRSLTETIAKGMGIGEDRAEKMKLSSKDFFSTEMGMDFPALELIISEIKRIISTVASQNNLGKIDGLIISGGSANLVGLSNYFSQKLGLKASIGNPLSRIDYTKELEPAMEGLRARFAVAVGLALRGASEFLKEDKK